MSDFTELYNTLKFDLKISDFELNNFLYIISDLSVKWNHRILYKFQIMNVLDIKDYHK